MLLAGLGTFIDVTEARISHRKEIHREALERLAVAATFGEDVRYEEAFTLSILAQELMANEPLEARAALERSLSLFSEIGHTYEMAAVTGILASNYVREGDYASAHEYQLIAVQLWETIGALQFLYRAKFQLARIKTELGQRGEGVAAMREVIALLKHAGKLYTAVQGEADLGTALLFFGQFAEAQALLESSTVFFSHRGESLYAASFRGRWCHARLHLGYFQEVWQEAQRVRDSHRAIEDASTVAIMEWLQGCAAIALGLPLEAVRLLKSSIEGGRAIDQPEKLSWALSASACVTLLIDDLVEARRQALEALRLTLKLHLLSSASITLPTVAMVLADAGNTERAVEVYELACQDPFVANSRWFETVYGSRVADAASQLPEEVVQAARERGAALDLWETVERLKEELERM
jgi:tetratricopeptide (TPR) repeat protein